VKSLDTELELRKVDINADHDARVADAEAEYQSRIMSAYMNPEGANTPATPEQLSADTKAHADTLFSLKKQYAEALHAEDIAIEKKKDALWTEMDQKALDEAATLGLTKGNREREIGDRPQFSTIPINRGLSPMVL
jgi:hypothetical protein